MDWMSLKRRNGPRAIAALVLFSIVQVDLQVGLAEPTVATTAIPISAQVVGRLTTSNNSPIAIIRNEDLILLKAEVLLATGDRPGALAHINFIRRTAGGLANTTDTGDPGLMNELIYNRRYSLFYEGWRWYDMRRWGRLADLPKDLPNGRIFSRIPVPLAECNGRSPAPAGCAPDPGI